jgi:peptide/nickel transport system ATP-binding protein
MSDSLLSVRNLVVEFPTRAGVIRAVDHVSFELAPGERLGLVGESGSGKSVLSRTVMGLTRAGSAQITGEVTLAGRSILGLSERKRRELWGREVAMVFQDPMSALHPITRIGDQIAEAVRRDAAVSRAQAHVRAIELLELVGIPAAAKRARARAGELSGGMRQRVMIAMAMACRPRLLIADEPTTALDVTVQARILELFDQLCDEFHIGLILVSHDLRVVNAHTDRVAVIYGGRIAELGPVRSVFEQPMMRYTEALLKAMPTTAGGTQSLPSAIPGLPPNLLDPPAGCRFAPRCRYAGEDCVVTAPALSEMPGDPERRFACWHPAGEPSASAQQSGTTGAAR